MTLSSQRSFIVNVSGISGHFDSKTGGETSADTVKHYNGGSLTPQVIAAPSETANVVVSRAYDHTRDYAAHKKARSLVGRWSTTLSVTPTDNNLSAIGKATVYPKALLVRVSEPDYDSGSSDPAMFELEFAISSVS